MGSFLSLLSRGDGLQLRKCIPKISPTQQSQKSAPFTWLTTAALVIHSQKFVWQGAFPVTHATSLMFWMYTGKVCQAWMAKLPHTCTIRRLLPWKTCINCSSHNNSPNWIFSGWRRATKCLHTFNYCGWTVSCFWALYFPCWKNFNQNQNREMKCPIVPNCWKSITQGWGAQLSASFEIVIQTYSHRAVSNVCHSANWLWSFENSSTGPGFCERELVKVIITFPRAGRRSIFRISRRSKPPTKLSGPPSLAFEAEGGAGARYKRYMLRSSKWLRFLFDGHA